MEGLLWGLFGLLAGLFGLIIPRLMSQSRDNRKEIDQLRTLLHSSEESDLQSQLKRFLDERSEESARTRQRLENLEAIVTSQEWEDTPLDVDPVAPSATSGQSTDPFDEKTPTR